MPPIGVHGTRAEKHAILFCGACRLSFRTFYRFVPELMVHHATILDDRELRATDAMLFTLNNGRIEEQSA